MKARKTLEPAYARASGFLPRVLSSRDTTYLPCSTAFPSWPNLPDTSEKFCNLEVYVKHLTTACWVVAANIQPCTVLQPMASPAGSAGWVCSVTSASSGVGRY